MIMIVVSPSSSCMQIRREIQTQLKFSTLNATLRGNYYFLTPKAGMLKVDFHRKTLKATVFDRKVVTSMFPQAWQIPACIAVVACTRWNSVSRKDINLRVGSHCLLHKPCDCDLHDPSKNFSSIFLLKVQQVTVIVTIVVLLRTRFARKFSNINFFLRLLPL